MGKIVVEDNLEEFEVVTSTGRTIGVVRFSPTDTGLSKRYNEVANKFESFAKADGESDEAFIDRLEADIKDMFDYLLGQKCSDIFFAEANPLAVLVNGKLYCEGVLDGIAKAIEDATETRMKRVRSRVDKYAKKYHK